MKSRVLSGPVVGWALYDWGNSAFATTVMAAFFPIMLKQYWDAGSDSVLSTARLGLTNSLAGLTLAIIAPLIGAIADYGSFRKRFLGCFALAGATATACLSFVPAGRWDIALVLFALGMIGYSAANVFYDALLNVVSPASRIHAVSALGYSMGYLGGGILFALNVWMTLQPERFGFASKTTAALAAFLLAGLWWAVFTLPILLRVTEPPGILKVSLGTSVQMGTMRLWNTFREIRALKPIFLFLIAYWFYIDGVDTIIKMAVDYGVAIGLDSTGLLTALIITQFIGFPSALAFGWIGERIGAKRGIFIALTGYLGVSVYAAFLSTQFEFYILAAVIGLIQGGVQALSRSMFSRMIPSDKCAEFFGFYNMMGKFAAVAGPALIGTTAFALNRSGMAASLASRLSIASVALLFLIGGMTLYFVRDCDRGPRDC